MTVGYRTLIATFFAAVALGVAAPALADHGHSPVKGGTTTTTPVSVQGVVQAVSPSVVMVRQLDGSSVSIAIDRGTKVTINGHPANINAVKPGFVLVSTVKPGQPASSLRFLRPN
jgi:hypothetical protein